MSAKRSRCSPTEALELLMRGGLSAPAAAKRLTDAIHDPDICRLWCDCKLVKPHFAVRLMVEPRYDEDEGRWMARIVSAVGEAWEKPDKPVYKWGTKDELEAAPYDWKLDVDEVKALLSQPELERPWPTLSGSVNWTPPAILAPKREAEPRNLKRRKRRRKPKPSESEKAKPPEPPPQPPTTTSDHGIEDKPRRNEPREYEEIRQFAARKWPGGYEHIATRDIIAAANSDEEFKKKVFPFPSRYQLERALGRRKK